MFKRIFQELKLIPDAAVAAAYCLQNVTMLCCSPVATDVQSLSTLAPSIFQEWKLIPDASKCCSSKWCGFLDMIILCYVLTWRGVERMIDKIANEGTKSPTGKKDCRVMQQNRVGWTCKEVCTDFHNNMDKRTSNNCNSWWQSQIDSICTKK